MSNLFTQDFRTTPYWWDHVPRPALPDTPLPTKVDVAVIGSGYTGLSAALQTARGGRDTLVLDAEEAGFGCSTRNGGQISTSIKPGFDALARRYGAERASGILQEGHNSLAWMSDFVAAERIDCDFRACGRFHAAHNPAQYEALARAGAGAVRGPEGRSACRPARRAAQRARHRRVFRRRGLYAARLGRSGPLPSGHARARARSRRHRHAALPCAPRFGATARRSASRPPRGRSRPPMSWSRPTAIPAG